MRFSTWLWEQLEEVNDVGRFANIAWRDVNNGCAHATFNARKWLEHIKTHHPERKDVLIPLLLGAYARYRLYIDSI
jgi:hypothetical protein